MKFILKLTGVLAMAAIFTGSSKIQGASQPAGNMKEAFKPQAESIVIKASANVTRSANYFRTMKGNSKDVVASVDSKWSIFFKYDRRSL